MDSPSWAIEGVRRRLKDESSAAPYVNDDNIDIAVQSAVRDHARYRPRTVVLDLTGDGTSFLELTAEDGWVRGFSLIKRVEYPVADISTDTRRPLYVEQGVRGWLLYQTPDADYLQFTQETPNADETVRIVFTSTHTLTEDESTVDDYDVQAVLDLATGIAARIASGRAATGKDGAIRTTSANPGGVFERLKELSRLWRARYFQHIGGIKDPEDGGDGVRAGMTILNWRTEPSHYHGWMTHERWRR